MRILMVHNRYLQRGGEDTAFEAEVDMLRNRNCDVVTYEEDNDKIASMGSLTVALKAIWSTETRTNIRACIRKYNREIIHVHNFLPLVSPSVFYAAKDEGIAAVQTLHNYRLACSAGTFFQNGQICERCLQRPVPWPAVRHACYRDSVAASTVVSTMLLAHRMMGTWKDSVDLFIALTDFARGKFIESGLSPEQIVVKPNFLSDNPDPGSADGDYAVFVGRLADEKGVKVLLSAWEHVRNRLPLKIIGDGPLVTHVLKAREHNEGIEFVGWLSREETLAMMGNATALIFPSEWYEGLPMVLIEALAKGTPVIASRIGGIPDIICHGRTGFLFEPGNPLDLVRTIDYILEHKSGLRQMRLQARQEFENKYTAEKNYELLETIYDKALTLNADKGKQNNTNPRGA